jgi:hypothetical protein
MKRFRELVAEIRAKYPGHDFFANFEESVLPAWGRHYRAYNDALMLLDNESWNILKTKAIEHFMDEREGQRKQNFFNQLNEAFAYRHLLRRGFRNVRFLQEGEKPTPDIRFLDRRNQSYSEVKTIGVSDDEIGGRKGEKAYSGTVYVSLSEGFVNKLKTDIEAAWKQIHSVGTSGLVFILVRFDDIALDYYDEYRAQLIKFGRRHGFKNVVIKVGHIGNRRITIPG